MEHHILETISIHVGDKKVIRRSQHGFNKGISCLTNLTAFIYLDETNTWMNEGRAVDVVYPDFFLNELGRASCGNQLPMLCPSCVLVPFLGAETVPKTVGL